MKNSSLALCSILLFSSHIISTSHAETKHSINNNKSATYIDEFLINSMALSAFKNNESAVMDYKNIIENLSETNESSTIKKDNEAISLINSKLYESLSLAVTKASIIESADIAILNNAAHIPSKSPNLAQAEKSLLKELAVKPGNATAWANYAKTLALNGKELLAIGAYANAIRFSENREKSILYFNALLEKENDPAIVFAIKAALLKSPKIAEWHECNLPIKIGDTIDQVQKAFKVNSTTIPSNYTKGAQFMDLDNIGISITFFIDGKVEIITLKEPFCGKINGIGIGDDLANLEIKMGAPKRPPSNFGDRDYVYGVDEDNIYSFRVNSANVITKITIHFNRTLFNQKSRR